MKIFKVEFEGVWPVGNCLIIAANTQQEAMGIAQKTMTHTNEIKVIEVDINEPKVIVYLSGEY